MKFDSIYDFLKHIFPYNRSLTGKGNVKTLKEIKKIIPLLKIKKIKSGTKVFDWKIPKEWNVNEAYIKDSKGKKIIDYKNNNLHLISYSSPFKKRLKLKNLLKIIYTLPKQPKAIPYITSYYEKKYGFCMSDNQKKKLKNEYYDINIDTNFKNGSLSYGELFLKGRVKKEVIFSSNICHPSMANNELSSPCVMTFLAKWISKQKSRHYSYRFIFVPETIGSIQYIANNLKNLKKNIICGFTLNCLGDNNNYSYVPSRNGDTFSDYILKKALKKHTNKFKIFRWKDRGSDERQYCSPGVDLPFCNISRTKYGEFKEYHTSLDDLNFVSKAGLNGSFSLLKKMFKLIEKSRLPQSKFLCEPMLGKRNLYKTNQKINGYYENKKKIFKYRNMMIDIISNSDGKNSLEQISEKMDFKLFETKKIYRILNKLKLITYNV